MILVKMLVVFAWILFFVFLSIFFFGIINEQNYIRELSIELCRERGWEFKSVTQECISLDGDWLVTKANIIIHRGEAYLSMVGGDK